MDEVSLGDRLGRPDHVAQRTQTETHEPQPDEDGDRQCATGDRKLEEQQTIEGARDARRRVGHHEEIPAVQRNHVDHEGGASGVVEATVK